MSAAEFIHFRGYEVRSSPFIPSGMVARNEALKVVFVRHLSELLHGVAGATWHVTADRCPSWSEATECRCMLGGEA